MVESRSEDLPVYMEEVSLDRDLERMDGSSSGAAKTPSLQCDPVEGGGN